MVLRVPPLANPSLRYCSFFGCHVERNWAIGLVEHCTWKVYSWLPWSRKVVTYQTAQRDPANVPWILWWDESGIPGTFQSLPETSCMASGACPVELPGMSHMIFLIHKWDIKTVLTERQWQDGLLSCEVSWRLLVSYTSTPYTVGIRAIQLYTGVV